MKLFDKEYPVGRKFVITLIAMAFIIIGVVVFNWLDIGFENFDKYVWGIVGVAGLGITGNVVNKRVNGRPTNNQDHSLHNG